jgi:hypothetical protein
MATTTRRAAAEANRNRLTEDAIDQGHKLMDALTALLDDHDENGLCGCFECEDTRAGAYNLTTTLGLLKSNATFTPRLVRILRQRERATA